MANFTSNKTGFTFNKTRAPFDKAGFTFIELLIALAILSFMGISIANLFSGSMDIANLLSRKGNTTRKLYIAMDKITKDIQHSYLFKDGKQIARKRTNKTEFIANEDGFFSKIDMVINNKTRYFSGSREPDLAEVGYFVENDSLTSNRKTLFRRESGYVNDSPEKGGVVNKLIDNVAEFKLKFSDGKDEDFRHTDWSSEKSEWKGRLPHAVEIVLSIYTNISEEDTDLSDKNTSTLRTRVRIENRPYQTKKK